MYEIGFIRPAYLVLTLVRGLRPHIRSASNSAVTLPPRANPVAQHGEISTLGDNSPLCANWIDTRAPGRLFAGPHGS